MMSLATAEEMEGLELAVCRASKMLLSNYIGPSTVQLLSLVTVCLLQRPKNAYIAWLQLMGGVRRKPTGNNDVFVT